MTEPDYVSAHKHCIRNCEEILQGELCGCFYCLEIFMPQEIVKWIDEQNPIGQTALCPRCGIDSVIGSASGYPITKESLERMNAHWF